MGKKCPMINGIVIMKLNTENRLYDNTKFCLLV